MTQTVVTTAGTFRVVPAGVWRTDALAVVPLLDEWTQAAPTVVLARSLTAQVFAHVTAGTLVLAGRPERALPHLATADAFVAVALTRPGYPEQRATVRIPLGSTLPYTAPPLPVASRTIALVGRVSAADFPHGPLIGAAVRFDGTPARPLAATTVPVALRHDEGVTVQLRTVTNGATTTLAAPATAGDATLALASTSAMPTGRVLLLATGEHVVVAATTGNLALLRAPLKTSPATGTPVTRLTLAAAGPTSTLAREALPGDGVLPLAATLPTGVLEIVDGPATEYRATGHVTDADGRWRLSGVRGITEIAITTAAAGFVTDGPTTVPLAPIDPFVINTALKI